MYAGAEVGPQASTVVLYGRDVFYCQLDYWLFYNEGHELYLTPNGVVLSYVDVPAKYLYFTRRPPHEEDVAPAPGAPDYPKHHCLPTLSSDGIELQYGRGGSPPHYPGSGTLVPVPDDAEPAAAVVPDGGGPQENIKDMSERIRAANNRADEESKRADEERGKRKELEREVRSFKRALEKEESELLESLPETLSAEEVELAHPYNPSQHPAWEKASWMNSHSKRRSWTNDQRSCP